MKQRLFFTSILLMICAFIPVCAQSNLAQRVRQSLVLSKATLQNATSIVYLSNNGSVPPDYRHDCKITVSKESVRLTITRGYDDEGRTLFDKTARLSADKYQKFINSLANQSISKTNRGEPMQGASFSCIRVCQGTSVLFEGEEGMNLKLVRGTLEDSFLMVLTPEMKKTYLKITNE